MEQINKKIANEIICKNNLREKELLSDYACLSSTGERRNPNRECIPDIQNIRSSFFHDTDRIIHSEAYTKYIDKTQVFYLFQNSNITHRALHVQFVSKIARVIGRSLNLNEDLIEAISLGHDLGHVAYSHEGESYLNQICVDKNIGFFCHNAQSVRFLMELENKGLGLNLTLQVLDGILCHNGEFVNMIYQPNSNKTWDEFLMEYDKCWTYKGYSKKLQPKTLEGCVMRVSDIIAYIGRDIEDAIEVCLIKREDIPKDISKVLGDTNDKIINNLAIDVINNSYGKSYIAFSKGIYEALTKLLKFNNENIYLNPKYKYQSPKIRNMFDVIFNKLLQDLDNNNECEIKEYVLSMDKSYIDKNSNEKMVVDYIARLTDKHFNRLFKEIILPRNYGAKF